MKYKAFLTNKINGDTFGGEFDSIEERDEYIERVRNKKQMGNYDDYEVELSEFDDVKDKNLKKQRKDRALKKLKDLGFTDLDLESLGLK